MFIEIPVKKPPVCAGEKAGEGWVCKRGPGKLTSAAAAAEPCLTSAHFAAVTAGDRVGRGRAVVGLLSLCDAHQPRGSPW